MCPRLSLQGSFSESWRNEIWALQNDDWLINFLAHLTELISGLGAFATRPVACLVLHV